MGKLRLTLACTVLGLIAACSSVAFSDRYYQLDDVSGKELRGDKPNHDRPLSDCKPGVIPSGGKAYKCVVHFYPDYQALLDRITILENQLRDVQQHCQGN